MLFCTLCYSAHVFLLVPGCVLHFHIVTIQSLIRKIASAMLTWRTGLPVLCSLRLLRHWLWIVTKNRAYKFTPLGRIHIRGTTQIPYVKNENYFYIHDKTLNSRNEWGNVIPYQIHALCSRILPVCGSRGNFDSAWTSGSFSAGGLPSLSGK